MPYQRKPSPVEIKNIDLPDVLWEELCTYAINHNLSPGILTNILISNPTDAIKLIDEYGYRGRVEIVESPAFVPDLNL